MVSLPKYWSKIGPRLTTWDGRVSTTVIHDHGDVRIGKFTDGVEVKVRVPANVVAAVLNENGWFCIEDPNGTALEQHLLGSQKETIDIMTDVVVELSCLEKNLCDEEFGARAREILSKATRKAAAQDS